MALANDVHYLRLYQAKDVRGAANSLVNPPVRACVQAPCVSITEAIRATCTVEQVEAEVDSADATTDELIGKFVEQVSNTHFKVNTTQELPKPVLPSPPPLASQGALGRGCAYKSA